jgi:hypothetical protein
MPANVEQWLKRAKEFDLNEWQGHGGHASEALQFAISITYAFYGPASPQLEILKRRAATDKQGFFDVYQIASGAIKNVVAEIDAGLITSIRLTITGEILADLISKAQETLDENSIEVAAVLAAAAFEDCMRRLAKEKAGVTSPIELVQVLVELKNHSVLKGGEPALANGLLKFRNDSLHAKWDNIEKSQISGCLAFLSSLIVKHLS